MPLLSIFTPCGHLKCSSNSSQLEQFYNLLPTLWGSELDFTVGTIYDEPKLYAVARMLATCLGEVDHAGNQAYPQRVFDLLPLLERDFGIIPGPNDSIQTRQSNLGAAELLPQGEMAANVVNALLALIGSGFLAYMPCQQRIVGGVTARTVAPASPGNGPGIFTDVRIPPRLVTLVDPVIQIGTSSWVGYQNADPTITTPTVLYPGDVVVVDAGNTIQQEKVQIAQTAGPAVPPSQATPGLNYALAIFQKSHDVGAPMLSGNFPYWWSTQRSVWVVCTQATAQNRVTRAKVDALCSKIFRGVVQWAIVQATTTVSRGGTVGPLTVGSPMGCVPVGACSFTNSVG